MSPSDFRDTLPLGLMVTHVSPQWPMLILNQASGGNCRALEMKKRLVHINPCVLYLKTSNFNVRLI